MIWLSTSEFIFIQITAGLPIAALATSAAMRSSMRLRNMFGEIAMHSFETLTLCPIDRRLIDVALLDDTELDWLNTYHARVCEEVSPLIEDESVKNWLEKMTAPLSR
mgnify:CR=1 FL=1